MTSAQVTDPSADISRRARLATLPSDFALRLFRGLALVDEVTAPEVHVGLVLVLDGWLRTECASDRLATLLDAAQFESRDGPATSPGATDEMVSSDNLLLDGRWPQFGREADALGGTSLVSYRVALSARLRMHLSLYGEAMGCFGAAARAEGWLLVDLLAETLVGRADPLPASTQAAGIPAEGPSPSRCAEPAIPLQNILGALRPVFAG